MRDGERKKRKNARKDIEVTDEEEEEEEEEEPACVFSETLLLLLSLLLLLLLLLLNFVVAEQKKSARVYFSLSLSLSTLERDLSLVYSSASGSFKSLNNFPLFLLSHMLSKPLLTIFSPTKAPAMMTPTYTDVFDCRDDK